MKHKLSLVTVCFLAIVASGWYMAEPWALTFIDDGPYFSTDFVGPVKALPVYSQVELRRFGHTVFSLESRLVSEGQKSGYLYLSTFGSYRFLNHSW